MAAPVYTRLPTGHRWTFDEDGTGTEIHWPGGSAHVGTDKTGTMGGGALQLERSPDGLAYVNAGPQISTVLAQDLRVPIPPGRLRPALSGSSAPDVTLFVV